MVFAVTVHPQFQRRLAGYHPDLSHVEPGFFAFGLKADSPLPTTNQTLASGRMTFVGGRAAIDNNNQKQPDSNRQHCGHSVRDRLD